MMSGKVLTPIGRHLILRHEIERVRGAHGCPLGIVVRTATSSFKDRLVAGRLPGVPPASPCPGETREDVCTQRLWVIEPGVSNTITPSGSRTVARRTWPLGVD